MKKLLLLLLFVQVPATIFCAGQESKTRQAEQQPVAATASEEPKRKRAVVGDAVFENPLHEHLPLDMSSIVTSYNVPNSIFTYLFGLQEAFIAPGNYINSLISADGSTLAMQSSDGRVSVYVWDDERYTKLYTTPEGQYEFSPALSSDGSMLAVRSRDESVSVYVWNGETYTVRYTTPEGQDALDPALSSDGSTLAAVSRDGRVSVYGWDGGTYTVRYTTPEGQDALYSVLSSDGSKLAVISRDGKVSVYVWNGKTYTVCYTTPERQYGFGPVLSSDGSTLAALSRDGRVSVYVWNGETYTVRYTMPERQAYGPNLVLSSDGSKLAAVSSDRRVSVYVWDGKTYTIRYTTPDKQALLTPVLSSDGSTLAAVSRDRMNSVYVWDGKTYTVRHTTPDEHGLGLLPTVLSSDGSTLAVSEMNGRDMHVYRTPFTRNSFNDRQLALLYEIYQLVPDLKTDEYLILNEQQSKTWLSLTEQMRKCLMETTKKRVLTPQEAITPKKINDLVKTYKPVVMNLRFTKVLPWARTLNKDLNNFFDSLAAIMAIAGQTQVEFLERLKELVKVTTTRITPDSFGSINPQAKAAWIQLIKELNLVAYSQDMQELYEALGSTGKL